MGIWDDSVFSGLSCYQNITCQINNCIILKSKSKLYYDRQSVGSPSWCQAPVWDPRPIFSFSLWLFLHSWGFVEVGCPLWREVGSEFFSFCRASPAQPFSGLSPTGLMSIVCWFYFWDSRNLVELSWIYFAADGQSTSSSWYRAPLWGPWPDFILVLSLVTIACFSSCRAPLLTKGRVCNLQCNLWLVRSLSTNNHKLPLIWDCVRNRSRSHITTEIFFRQLRVCNFVAPSLTRTRVCSCS
jgi:hypothetical protein